MIQTLAKEMFVLVMRMHRKKKKEEEEEEEEETEEDKRRKLIERMAKISGGRNMFGMMGMPTPFGLRHREHQAPRNVIQLKSHHRIL